MTEQVGQYEIKGVLGGGGMATVYRGEHVSGIGMTAAIKKLHPHLAEDDELRARLKIEAQALARLKHRNIVQLFDYVDADGACALVTELVEGRTLRAVMAEFTDWPMPTGLALLLFRQVLEGVGHAHRHACLHRDIKPGNIMVTADNQVKILDFGIANLIDTERLTSTGVAIGTPVYMAPEQLEGRHDLDQRADLYSLGMTLWEMLAGVGARPIGQRGWRLADEHLDALLDRQVPAPLVELVRKLVQEDREDRYMSCDEVLDALAAVVEGGGLDEESSLALAGVAGSASPDGLPTFEFEATAPGQRLGPIAQTVRSVTTPQGRARWGRGSLIATGLILLAVAVGLSQMFSDAGSTEGRIGGAEPEAAVAVAPAVRPISLLLQSDPAGAILSLDGEVLGNQGLTTTVPAIQKDYLLTASLDGFQPGSTVCRIGAIAIEAGSFRCTVPLQRLETEGPSAGSTESRAARSQPVPRPRASPRRESVDPVPPPAAEGGASGATPADRKPKIYKIE